MILSRVSVCTSCRNKYTFKRLLEIVNLLITGTIKTTANISDPATLMLIYNRYLLREWRYTREVKHCSNLCPYRLSVCQYILFVVLTIWAHVLKRTKQFACVKAVYPPSLWRNRLNIRTLTTIFLLDTYKFALKVIKYLHNLLFMFIWPNRQIKKNISAIRRAVYKQYITLS